MKKYLPILKYLFLFFFFFVCLVFVFTLSRGDTFVNYGFSYAIRMGEVPYKDFNIVISPLAPILYSVGLFVWNNIVMYYLEQAFLLTLLFYLLEKMLGKKSALFLLGMLLPYPVAMASTIFPGYNFLLFFLLLLFFYAFQNKKSPYLLGVLLGLIFCTKQTIGLVLFLPTFYYLFTNRKKFLSMLLGFLIPCIFLLLYLLITGSIFDFFNLCFLGLLDFGSSNHEIDIFYWIVSVIGTFYLLYRIWNDKRNMLLYYGLFFGVVVFPIIDYYHVSLFLLVPLYFFLEDLSIKREDIYRYVWVMIFSICIIWSVVLQLSLHPILYHFPRFSFSLNSKRYTDNVLSLNQYTRTLDKDVVYFMRGSENYFYKIMQHERITYFDLPNYGNYGYDGLSMMKERIDSVQDCYFVLDHELLLHPSSSQQYTIELGEYIIKNSVFVKNIGLYDIYYKE